MTDLLAAEGTLSRDRDDAGKVAELTEIVDQLRADFKARDALYDDIDKVIYGEVPVLIPEAYQEYAEEVRSPLPIHITNTITAAMTVNPPTTQFLPVGFGDTHQENATLREHFFDASWRRQEDEADSQLFRKFMHALITKGEGVLKTTERSKSAFSGYDTYSRTLQEALDSDEYRHLDQREKDTLYHGKTEEYKKGRAGYPITTVDVPPETYYYLRGAGGVTCVAEVKRVPYLETLAKYAMGLDGNGKVCPAAMGMPIADWHRVMSKVRTLLMVEFWTHKDVSYLLLGPGDTASGSGKLGRGQLVKSFRHGYGDPVTKSLRGPYFQAQGVTTSSRQPDRTGLSVIYGFLPLFPLLDRLLTARGANATLTAYASFKRLQPPTAGLPDSDYGRDGTEKRVGSPEVIEPGTIYPYDVGPIEMPEGGRELDKMLGEVRGLIELALPSVVQGVVDTTDSGYALNQAVHLAMIAWSPIVSNAERALAKRVGFESWLIENKVMETVYCWGEPPKGKNKRGGDAGWLGIGPDELNGVHRYKVRLDPDTPSNRVIDVRQHAEMVVQGFETKAMAIEELGGNPDEVERGLLLEMLKADPAILDRMKQGVFQQLALADQRRLAEAAPPAPPADPGAALGQTGQVYQPGQEGMPLVPTPAGAVTGAGVGSGLPANPAGMAGGVPNAPGAALPLPGQM